MKNTLLFYSLFFLACKDDAHEKHRSFLEKQIPISREIQNQFIEKYQVYLHQQPHFIDSLGLVDLKDSSQNSLHFKASIVGFYNDSSGIWKWAWKEKKIPWMAKQNMRQVQEFGEKEKLIKLIAATWKAEKSEPEAMALLSLGILRGLYIYQDSVNLGRRWILLRELESNP